MKRPLHVLIVGLIVALWGGYTTASLWNRTDLTAIGLFYSIPLLIFGVLLLLAYAFYTRLQSRFQPAVLYPLCFGLSILLSLLVLVISLATQT